MAKRILVRGRFEYIPPEENHFNGIKWVDDPNGKFVKYIIEYNWIERILIKLSLMRDKSYSKYILGIDPFKSDVN